MFSPTSLIGKVIRLVLSSGEIGRGLQWVEGRYFIGEEGHSHGSGVSKKQRDREPLGLPKALRESVRTRALL